ncbi:glycerophosphodiester phosphodiesterase [Comamonas serinivorans]|uniref:Glycerophosphodiester phosphodiesterase n=1 Tax=Comamonas serinivorans TaxID=1082851 RepID=A0A1Y0EMV5_9BURK|nr:glycerophosphodiester phosphodiesterase [Comamonas serinivorans]ARU04994.1 glycerophosphodiester phosphodiesterase [Comamonas serinivorans]
MRTSPAWPCPRWIAHRGAGHCAPENTLAAIRAGAARRYRMAECDVKLSADGVLFLLHDDTLQRTSNGHGPAGAWPWARLSQLDAGTWHSAPYAGEPLPHLTSVLRYCRANGMNLNLEIKPNPGQAEATGRAVVQALRAHWPPDATPPLLSSFQPAALQAAAEADAHWPRALLLASWPRHTADALQLAQDLDCVGLVAEHRLWQASRVQAIHDAGLACAAYTVNDAREAERLLALGVDSLITDAVDAFTPD